MKSLEEKIKNYYEGYDEDSRLIIEKMMDENEIKKIIHIGTDGIADILRASVNEFTDEEFNLWIKFHLDTCENPNLIGYSKHGLYIGRKNN
ncbi:hypothetical protein [Paeniclostridium hominis]|uniref:hypothetical protein n=1 Tax=Paeniclostridium hominis TaxID=2764329 RepID=UPI0022E31F3D|nr:hypothetical protein [Paeniclostridium hominis]